jgi:hypothetical protein
MIAFDYAKQEWVTGWAAAALLIIQSQETLAAMDDPQYLALVGLKLSDGDRHRARLRKTIAEAERFLHSGRQQ